MYSQVLQALRGTGVRLTLDIKPSDKLDHERVMRETEQPDMVANVIVSPRTVANLREFNQLNPALRTLGFVGGTESEPPDLAAIEAFALADTDMIRMSPSWIFEDRDGEYGSGHSPFAGRMHELGKPVWTTADVEYRDIDPEHPPRRPGRADQARR